MISILTDSCSDLSDELLQKHQILVVPLTVILGEKSYKDGSEVKPADLFDYVKQTGQLPKTSAVSVEEFIRAFEGMDEIIFIGIGSKLSATIQSAELVKKSLPDKSIHIVDSNNLSTGIGLLAIKAAELRDKGHSAQQITTELRHLAPKVQTSFLIDTLEYLYKGGRCSAITNIVGSLLKIRPIIEVKDGALGVKEKISGSRRKALEALVDGLLRNLDRIDHDRVFITHTGADSDAVYLKDRLAEIAPIKDICITTAGATISSHCGPNTIGILYFLK